MNPPVSAATPPPGDAAATSLAPVSASGLFELIGQSGLIDNGQALLVSIAAIKEALGARWESRREQIHQVVERHFLKHLSPGDICHLTNDTSLLVATPDKPTILAQAICYRALKEVLTYFLGEVQPADLRVDLVTELSADCVAVRPFTVAELEQADAQALPPPRPAEAESSLSSLVAWPLLTADGQDLKVSFAVDPVMDLKAWAMAGHRIEARILNQRTGAELTNVQRRGLLPRDFEQIDLAALDRGLSRLTGGELPDKPKLIIQLSFASVSNGRARAALLDRAREHQPMLTRAAICELVDVEPGVPSGRLTEVAALIRGVFRSVWIQVEPVRVLMEAAMTAKVGGLTVRAGDLGQTPDAISDGLRRFARMVGRPSYPLTVTSLPGPELLIEAMGAGFSHATLRGGGSDDANPAAARPAVLLDAG